ncbi:hypothetical protein V8E51_020027 [Hyaloscypha variabilis]
MAMGGKGFDDEDNGMVIKEVVASTVVRRHSRRGCPNPAKPRPCYNCGEEGHNKADCTNETIAREFTGTCRVYKQVGHRASDYPNKPPEICKNCQEEGHGAFECKNPRKIDCSKLLDVELADYWAKIKKAVANRDLEDLKEAIQIFLKAIPETTYAELEKAFRA